jgi:O-acetyl-ADP-ribose deacetylase (regulator of RNase III)
MIFDTFLNGRVIVKVGDLTEEATDAIVNAANSTLLGGGGVDGAIHHAGGPQILKECQEIRQTTHPKGLPTGEAVITSGGNLRARHVIHTVGPVYGTEIGREAELLANAYLNSLKLAVENNVTTIAFPSISTGAFSYPRHEAAQVSSDAIRKHLETDTVIREIRLVFFSRSDAEMFVRHHVLAP